MAPLPASAVNGERGDFVVPVAGDPSYEYTEAVAASDLPTGVMTITSACPPWAGVCRRSPIREYIIPQWI